MSYRPQFLYSTPEKFKDEDFIHYFDQHNTTQLNNALSLAAGGTIIGIPLQLETDAPFFWRGLKIDGPANYAVRLRDPYGNYLTDDYVPLPLGFSPDAPTVAGSPVIPMEPEVPCPAGSVILVDIKRIN